MDYGKINNYEKEDEEDEQVIQKIDSV